jgi:hypothetical protein
MPNGPQYENKWQRAAAESKKFWDGQRRLDEFKEQQRRNFENSGFRPKPPLQDYLDRRREKEKEELVPKEPIINQGGPGGPAKSFGSALWRFLAKLGGIWVTILVLDQFLGSPPTAPAWPVWIGAIVVGYLAYKILNSELIRALGTVVLTFAALLGLIGVILWAAFHHS